MAILTGNVFEMWSNDPVEGADISIRSEDGATELAVRKADVGGYFAAGLSKGNYVLVVSAPGHETLSIHVGIFSDVHQNILLKPIVRAL